MMRERRIHSCRFSFFLQCAAIHFVYYPNQPPNRGAPPWKEMENLFTAMYHISHSEGGPDNIPEDLSEECLDFLELCFRRDWNDRPEAKVHTPLISPASLT